LAYVADGDAGLRIIDVTNPSQPFQRGLFDTPGVAFNVAVVGSLAYVADFDAGLRIIDVTNPSQPFQRGFFDTPGFAIDVTVMGGLAYVADEESGLRIIDVTNPARPVERGFFDTPGDASGVAVIGTLAYVADDESGLRVIDVSNPSQPVERGFFDTPDRALGVAAVGTLAFVADGASGVFILRIADPSRANPDLAVRQLMVSPTNPAPGDTVSVSFSIMNQGTAMAGAATHYVVLSKDATIDASDRFLADRGTPDLAAGNSFPIQVPVIIPADTVAGAQFIGVIADVENTVMESNEVNNTAAMMINVRAGSAMGRPPDRIVSELRENKMVVESFALLLPKTLMTGEAESLDKR
jgi:hypothetical protein